MLPSQRSQHALTMLLFTLSLNFPLTLSQMSGNPVIDGWYADPEARVYEGAYYIYPTVSTVFENQTYYEAFTSPDLLTWENVGRILDFADIPWTTNRAAWAPSVGHKDGTYYLYFSAGDGVGIGVASSPSPAGPFKDVLGEPLVAGTHFGAQAIDAMVFMDGEGPEGGDGSGKNWLYWGGWGHAVVAELGDDMVSFKSEFLEITPDEEYVEGPWMLKRRGVYYFMYSVGGWTDGTYGVKYMIADSPTGPFRGPAKKILSGDPAVGTGAGHHSVFHVGDDYYIAYHRRFPDDNERDHRVTCIDRMYFTADGEIEIVRITVEGVEGRQL
ncbi:hypothetical protein AJ79_01114 [Helicocarpus griseus UAMH5409]|uniref:Xylosidase/arabinosidase n=1 Tax=Helicocarpus griseus UAMH5409 TaxID=1447875 RepID=A0A2B7Y0D1_9EURO|nr:hypothetical protein AJ79_01114 [Helicocarpus griseus UAMH5409]